MEKFTKHKCQENVTLTNVILKLFPLEDLVQLKNTLYNEHVKRSHAGTNATLYGVQERY